MRQHAPGRFSHIIDLMARRVALEKQRRKSCREKRPRPRSTAPESALDSPFLGSERLHMDGLGKALILPAMACLLGSLAGNALAEPVTLRLGYGAAAEEPLWLVVAKPELARNSGKVYKLDATRFTGSDKRAQAFEAGAIDLASSSANGVIFAAAEGVAARIIASISRESSRGFSTSFYVKESSPIKSVPDLKGRIVAINGFSTSGHLWLKAALAKHALDDGDVTIAPIPFPAMQESLEAGKVDVAELPQPFAALAEKQMKVRKIFDAKYGIPFDEELIVLIGKDEFLKKNAEAVRAFLADLEAATQFYLERPGEARALLIDAKMVRVIPDVYLTMKDYYRDPNLRVDADALEKMQEFQIKAGFQKKKVDARSLVDPGYLPR
jgi:ABC-type nitrate/sulfonate/bicarbonate transport system substrate-binding protein